MRRPSFYFVAGLVTGLLILGLPLAFILMQKNVLSLDSGGAQYKVIATAYSPDERFTATVYQGMGGGAAGWCRTRVVINRATKPFNLEAEEKRMSDSIFDVSCGSDVSVQWQAKDSLLVSYDFPTTQGNISLYKKRRDASNQIRIEYQEKEAR